MAEPLSEDDVTRLAGIVADRVFEGLAKFVDVIEGTVRENEQLRVRIEHLEMLLYGPDSDDDDADDEFDLALVPDEEIDGFFDDIIEESWEVPDEDDVTPTFD